MKSPLTEATIQEESFNFISLVDHFLSTPEEGKEKER